MLYCPHVPMRKSLPFVSAFLSALLLWAAFPPMGETCALACALAPLLAVSRLCAPRRAAWAWFFGGFLFWAGTLAWMPAIVKNGGPLPLVILGWAGLAALCAGYFALFGWLGACAWRRVAGRGRGKILVLLFAEPVLWAGVEWLRSWLFTGFAWNFLGTALGPVPALAAPARLGGVYLVSALVVLLNGVFATLVCRLVGQMCPEGGDGRLELWRTAGGSRWGRTCETALPLGAVLLVFGLANAACLRPASGFVPLRVALVQRNAPCIFSRLDRGRDPFEVFGRLLQTAEAARPDLVVWAESAMAEFGALGSDAARRAAHHFSRKTGGASLLAGGDWWFTAQTAEGPERRVWNAAALYAPADTNVEVQVYGKQHLVPFGEYIPFDKWVPALQRLSPIGVSVWPGEARTLALRAGGRTVRVAPLICYEDTDPVLARRAARLGAQAIALITNDSWFSHSQEPVQHAWQAVLRAIETGLPVIRVGNSGVTGVIAPSGRARWLEDGEGRPLVDAAGAMVETVAVPAAPARTPYARAGDAPLACLFALALAGVFARRPGTGK